MRSELDRAQQLKEFASDHLNELEREVENSELKEGDLWAQAESIRKIIDQKKSNVESSEQKAQEQAAEIKALEQEIASLEKLKKSILEKAFAGEL